MITRDSIQPRVRPYDYLIAKDTDKLRPSGKVEGPSTPSLYDTHLYRVIGLALNDLYLSI